MVIGYPNKMYALIMILKSQREQIERHCFGDCGKIIIGSGYDKDLGEMAICRESECKYLDKQMDEPFGAISGEPVYLRKLKEEES